jgi:microcystin-dependent protein
MKRFRIIELAVLLTVAIGAGPLSAAIWQWSLTPATNGTADPSINWAAGNAPSAVNPSARAMMARIAEWRDDTSGSLTTTGSGNAYLLATNQAAGGGGICASPLTAPPNGTQLAFTASFTNSAASPTLQVDTCPAAAIVVAGAGGAALNAASMIAQSITYRVTYQTSITSWVVQNTLGTMAPVPLGAVLPFTGSVVPIGWAWANGQCLLNATYPAYYALLGSPGPGACSAGYFQVIDLRGRVAAGLDNLGGASAANRLTSSAQGCGTAMTSVGAFCANGVESQTLTVAQLPAHTHSGTTGVDSPDHSHGYTAPGPGYGTGTTPNYFNSGAFAAQTGGASTRHTHSFTTDGGTGGGVASPNVMPALAVNYIIRVQ